MLCIIMLLILDKEEKFAPINKGQRVRSLEVQAMEQVLQDQRVQLSINSSKLLKLRKV